MRLSEGLIVAASTPAAPGPESLLLRSGRVTEDAWTNAYTVGAPSGRLVDELIEQNAISAAGMEVICLSALFDAVFAIALFPVEGCTSGPDGDDPPPLLPVAPGVSADRLIRELSRRLDAATAWRETGVTAQCRPRVVSAIAAPDIHANRLHQAVLEKSNGRRTPRDIAFALGQGLFAVMQSIAALVADERLEISAGPAASSAPPVVAEEPQSSKLPRRRKGASKVNDVLPLPPQTPTSPLRPRTPRESKIETES
ncbi:hypothetical protein J5X84_22395 [Streptosporangiaceae bacterium NEAU-GS5]|nr:hypothetical protein [Streptosporangiaceae bacterium NEAU-GS5]